MRRSPYEWIRVRVAPKYFRKLRAIARRRQVTLTAVIENMISKEGSRDDKRA